MSPSALSQLRSEIVALAGQLNAALATLSSILGGGPDAVPNAAPKSFPHTPAEPAAEEEEEEMDHVAVTTTEPEGAPSPHSVALSGAAHATHTPEPVWPGDDPMYGDPGVGLLPPSVLREFGRDLPHLVELVSYDEIKDARRGRFMARHAPLLSPSVSRAEIVPRVTPCPLLAG